MAKGGLNHKHKFTCVQRDSWEYAILKKYNPIKKKKKEKPNSIFCFLLDIFSPPFFFVHNFFRGMDSKSMGNVYLYITNKNIFGV